MDDLMNRVGALIEEHVKSEVEARTLIHSIQIKECQARECSCPSEEFNIMRKDRDEAQALAKERLDAIDNLRAILKDERKAFDVMRDERDAERRSASKYRVMWEQLHRAQSEDLDAKEQLKELLSTLGLAHFDRDTIKKSIELSRNRDLRLRSERDEAKAQLEVACAKVRELEAQLLEVRKAVGEKAPEESAKAPPKQSEFQVGDLVARHPRGPGCWGKVHAVKGDYVRVSYPTVGEGLYWHMERELTRKPVEVGDTVRVTIESHAGKRGKLEVLGESDRWCDMVRLDESSLLYVPRRYLVAIAP